MRTVSLLGFLAVKKRKSYSKPLLCNGFFLTTQAKHLSLTAGFVKPTALLQPQAKAERAIIRPERKLLFLRGNLNERLTARWVITRDVGDFTISYCIS